MVCVYHQVGLSKKYWYLLTYIPLKLYPQRGSLGISDIPPRQPRFTKIS
jgi:hypothetical protein